MTERFSRIARWWRRESFDGVDAVASLIVAAREDASFRESLLFILRLPLAQRESLVQTGLEQMRLRGELRSVQQAFSAISTDEGARIALALLGAEPAEANRSA